MKKKCSHCNKEPSKYECLICKEKVCIMCIRSIDLNLYIIYNNKKLIEEKGYFCLKCIEKEPIIILNKILEKKEKEIIFRFPKNLIDIINAFNNIQACINSLIQSKE